MKLYLAVAVLMLAFVAYTEAQDADPSQDQLQQIGQKAKETILDLFQRATAAFEQIKQSDMAAQAKAMFEQSYEKMTNAFTQ